MNNNSNKLSIIDILKIIGTIISFIVALLASALPVYRIARKQPIDAINNR